MRPRVKQKLLARVYRDENGEQKLQIVSHNWLPKPRIMKEIEDFKKELRNNKRSIR